MAISNVVTCRAGETVDFIRPQAPTAGSQNVMVSVQMPEGIADEDEELSAILMPLDPSSSLSPQPATAVLRTSYRTTFFFLAANARESQILQVRHPDSLTHRQELTPLSGGVRELSDIALKPNVSFP